MLREHLCDSKSGKNNVSNPVFDGESNGVTVWMACHSSKLNSSHCQGCIVGAGELHLLPSQVGITVLRQTCGSKSSKNNFLNPVFGGESNGANCVYALSLIKVKFKPLRRGYRWSSWIPSSAITSWNYVLRLLGIYTKTYNKWYACEFGKRKWKKDIEEGKYRVLLRIIQFDHFMGKCKDYKPCWCFEWTKTKSYYVLCNARGISEVVQKCSDG